jgi:hypothetical protein
MQKLMMLSEKYNYWLASPQENEAVGLSMMAKLQN